MKALEERIRKDGFIGEGDVLKIDSFVNHQIDVSFVCEMGKEFRRLYDGVQVDKILTIEASGIGIACLTAQYFGCPVVFAKKGRTSNLSNDVYTSQVYSYTHQRTYDVMVAKQYLHAGERVLIIDDFLANGSALRALWKLVKDAGATAVGAGIVVEKAFQPGGAELREEGLRIESLARVASMGGDERITFCD